jgi:histidine ammonia-lyase
MSIILEGQDLTIEKLVHIARGEPVELGATARERIQRCRRAFEVTLESGEVIYGVNTGIGEFSERRLSADEMASFQENLIRSHAAGVGDPAPAELVRAAMAARLNVLAKGRSACRPVIADTLLAMLNGGVTPVVCLRGSVGACGDLAPMAQIALLLLGEGEAWFRGERLPGRVALERAGIKPPGVMVRDGLATINGSNVLTSASALSAYQMGRCLRQAEIAASMSIEALGGNLSPFDPLLHQARGFAGSIASARAIVACMEGGDLARGPTSGRVQDAYSIRSTPQIVGAARDALEYARRQVEIELNGVGDNPVIFPELGRTLTGANFQGIPVSLPMDLMGAALTAVCVLSERRLNRLLNPALSNGLPPFLAHNPGPHSGLMLSQYTAGALIVEQRILSAPACVGSIPAAADQEDFVSMGMTTAIKNMTIVEHACAILGIELMAAAQALDLRGRRYGRGVETARRVVRRHVSHLEVDRQLSRDHDTLRELVRSGEVLDAVEAEVGSLG